MKISIPADCGNSPRMAIVAEIVSAWIRGDAAALGEWFADDVSWQFVGGGTLTGPDVATTSLPSIKAEAGTVLSVVNHGKFAACDGQLEGDGKSLQFAHMLRFTGAARTAKVAEVRSYLLSLPGG